MLSGDPIPVDGVGHLVSPTVKQLYPKSGIGSRSYNLYLNCLSWDKQQLLQFCRVMRWRGVDKVNKPVFTFFDVVTLLPPVREFCREVLSFFMLEKLMWNDGVREFSVVDKDDDRVVGTINRDNFEDIRIMMLQLNYIGLHDNGNPTMHSSDKSRELWERTQKFLSEQAKKSSTQEGKIEYRLGNIVSKVCSAHPSYNLLNIRDLTIFQLYDTFFQVGYLRSIALREQIFSNHGGDKFRFEDWLQPILK
jgi:hypothetical protein